ncbi:hypothetical protein NUW58_g1042 [Xylaria curta]|uniref:Uncharacterized protein n=1 Tax=Xylaria curta TaxID=42375 RepID=A0ACC1PQB6_9PEZI|nr:hypothetical protein NUW58_g1042 [Xylaria curta]
MFLSVRPIPTTSMFRRPPNPAILILGAVILLLLVRQWVSPPIWLRTSTGTAIADARIGIGHPLRQCIYNSTLGFEKIFVVSLPSRTDRRDGMTLAAALSNVDFEFIDGVDGSSIPDNALPQTSAHDRPSHPTVGAWRGHMNAIQEVVKRNLSSALILEDDVDWDVRLRNQLQDFAVSANALAQPLANAAGSLEYADTTYPNPSDKSPNSLPDLAFDRLPATTAPLDSPYGDEWDVLWLGHCGMHFPFANDVQDGICSLGYAVTRRSARKLLHEVGLRRVNTAFDIMLRWFCEGAGDPNRGYHNCLTTQPSLFQIHLAAGPKKYNSDISDHGVGDQEEKTEVLRWSVKMNTEALMGGRTDFVDQYPNVD